MKSLEAEQCGCHGCCRLVPEFLGQPRIPCPCARLPCESWRQKDSLDWPGLLTDLVVALASQVFPSEGGSVGKAA